MSGRSWGGWLCLCIAFGSLTLLARLIGAPTGRRVAYLSAAGVADDRQQNGSTAADDSSQPAREVHVFTPPPPINPLLPRIWFDIVLRNSSTDDPKHPKHSGYQQPLVALGEGLQQLGVYFRASSDYWEDQFHGGHLFRAAARHEPPESFDVLVSTWMRPAPLDSRDGSFRDLPAPFFVPASRRSYLTAMIDWRLGDPLKSHYLERLAPLFDIYMRAHWSDYNTPRPLPSGLQPSAFYLTRRILHTLGGLTRTLDPVPASGGTGGNSGRSSGRASDHGDHVGAESDHGVDVAATSRIARDTRILWPHCNFISMGHTVRREAYERIYSRLLRLCQRTDQLGGRKLAPAGTLERRFWEQTGGRHNAYYFKSLLRCARHARQQPSLSTAHPRLGETPHTQLMRPTPPWISPQHARPRTADRIAIS